MAPAVSFMFQHNKGKKRNGNPACISPISQIMYVSAITSNNENPNFWQYSLFVFYILTTTNRVLYFIRSLNARPDSFILYPSSLFNNVFSRSLSLSLNIIVATF